jgi:hypothetical protein
MFSTTMAVVKNVVPVVAAAVAANTTNFCLPIWQAERNHFFLFSSEVLESIERGKKTMTPQNKTRINFFALQVNHKNKLRVPGIIKGGGKYNDPQTRP